MDSVAEQQLPDGEDPLEEGCDLLHPGPGVRHPELVARRQVADLEVGVGGAEHALEVIPVTEAPAIKEQTIKMCMPVPTSTRKRLQINNGFERCYKRIV